MFEFGCRQLYLQTVIATSNIYASYKGNYCFISQDTLVGGEHHDEEGNQLDDNRQIWGERVLK